MVAADVAGGLAGVFEVDGVLPHPDGEGADGRFALFGRHRADQRGVEPPAQEEAHLRVGDQPLFDAPDELLPDIGAGGVQAVMADRVRLRDVAVADEFPVFVVMPGREGLHLGAEADEVLGLAREDDGSVLVVAVVERADADRVAGGDIFPGFAVVEDEGELRVEHREHPDPVLPVHRQQDLAVGAACEGVFARKGGFEFLIAVNFAVADKQAVPEGKGLHPRRGQPHDGEAVESKKPLAGREDAAVVRAARKGAGKTFPERFQVGDGPAIAHNGTHDDDLQFR